MFAVLISLVLAAPVHAAEKLPELPLSTFLAQVKKQNSGIASAQLEAEGARLRSGEGGLLFAPALFANLQMSSDAKETVQPAFQGTKTIYNLYNLGVSQQTRFGLNAKLYYQLNFTGLVDASPNFIPLTQFHEAKPVLELTQSLWRNGGGQEVRSNSEALSASAAASSHAASYRVAAALAEAEGAYWRLSLAREAVALQKDAYDRSLRLKEWTDRRVNLHLAEASDRLQSDAAVSLRQLELQQAVDEESSASRAFNSLRSVHSSSVAETLEKIDGAKIRALAPPAHPYDREDVQAAREQARAASANASAAKERNKPTLELFGQMALNAKAAALGDAVSHSFNTEHPTVAAGVRFQTPLDFGGSSDVRAGYAREVASSERQLDRKLFEQEADWIDSEAIFEQAKGRYDLAEKIEQIQRDKYRTEQDRHKRGRTTTFQVLQFEQDYQLSGLSRLRAAAEILSIQSRLKLYSSGSAPGAAPASEGASQ